MFEFLEKAWETHPQLFLIGALILLLFCKEMIMKAINAFILKNNKNEYVTKADLEKLEKQNKEEHDELYAKVKELDGKVDTIDKNVAVLLERTKNNGGK